MSYKRFNLLMFSSFALGLIFCVAYFSQVQMRDIKRYMRLAKRDALATTLRQTEQKRRGVVKDIYIAAEDGTRLHHRITSDSSSLVVEPMENAFAIIEQLQEMRCLLQDKFYQHEGDLMQQLRCLSASSGTYHFNAHQFSAHNAMLSLVRTQGSELPLPETLPSPFLQGKAAEVTLVLAGKVPQFTAKQFVATLDRP